MYKIQERNVRVTAQDLINKYQDKVRIIQYCKECPNYGKKWSCPPVDFNVDEYLLKYKYVHMICTKIIFDPEIIEQNTEQTMIDKISTESVQSVRNRLSENLLSWEAKYPGSISVVSGGCNLCEECTRVHQEPCRHPEKMRYSLDTFGFDVTHLLKDLFDVKLKWEKGRLPKYFTQVSAFVTNHNLPDGLL